MSFTRRGRLLSAAVALTVVFAVACSGSESKDESRVTTAPTASPAAGQAVTPQPAGAYTPLPKDQQVLTVNLGAEPDFLDPHKSQFLQDIGVERLLFRGLFATDEKGTVIPAVAASVPSQQNGGVSADGKMLKITLKDGQKWSDGSALTARDFEYALRRSFNPKLASPYSSIAFNITGSREYYNSRSTNDAELRQLRDNVGVKAIDDKTLEIELREPQPTMLTILSLWIAYPVKQSVVEAAGPEENTKWTEAGKLIGNGPFVLKERRPKDIIVVETNPNYTAGEKPKLQKINLHIIEDVEAAFNAFQAGELDMVAVPPSKVPVVASDPNLKKLNVRGPDPTVRGVLYQVQVKPLDNPKVRLALSKAIDREAFVRVVRAGVAEPTQTWLPPGVPGYEKSAGDAHTFDPAAARQLLAEAGFPNGQSFPELSFTSSDSPLGKQIAEFFQKQYKDHLNINIKLDLVDSKTRSSRYFNSRFELFYGGWQEDYHDPENWLSELFESTSTNNQQKYSNARFDELVRAAKFEQNNEKRLDLYRQAHKLLMDDCALAPIEAAIRNTLIKSKVKGVVLNPQDAGFTGDHSIEKIEIAKES